jgi:hypothetical protein
MARGLNGYLFFAAFALLQQFSVPAAAKISLRSWVALALVTLTLMAVEAYRWGGALQAETLHFLLHATDHLWFVLPAAEQTPMSAWNRTPMQSLITTGMSPGPAQAVALGLWLLPLAITLGRVRKAPLTFPVAFALALVLLYWGRPVGWGFIYLEVVVAIVAWPTLSYWQKPAFVGIVVALMASRWWALLLTLRGEGMALLTLQSAEFPWETFLVLPLSWLLLLSAMGHRAPSATRSAISVAPSGR